MKMDERIAIIRAAERKSHIDIYTTANLFQDGTWLKKPIKTVLDTLHIFEGYEKLRVLDLGSGIGRNCIPVAQKFFNIDCQIDCVDILDLAIEQLYQYSEQYNVRSCINGIVMPLENYHIKESSYDLIMAISSLEHVNSEETFFDALKAIQIGVNRGGLVCLVINSNVIEVDKELDVKLDPKFEVNFPTDTLIAILRDVFRDWKFLKFTTVKQQYDIPRESIVNLSTDVVTLVAQK
jgi:cyclopropane fatty-acyl-phospholipid synthase-like methyltransferase